MKMTHKNDSCYDGSRYIAVKLPKKGTESDRRPVRKGDVEQSTNTKKVSNLI